ncbi:hypothetical protein GCM10023195_48310 [Actinoallomurus liliacearum]|uniref:Uncharacterized protein n=1 Tax=Actinoallomurus liliacearum TaxID=1080073 RepID=A0ABP8TPZ8_9ACTN
MPGQDDPLAGVADTVDELREVGPGLRHWDLSCHAEILAFCTFLLFCTELEPVRGRSAPARGHPPRVQARVAAKER